MSLATARRGSVPLVLALCVGGVLLNGIGGGIGNNDEIIHAMFLRGPRSGPGGLVRPEAGKRYTQSMFRWAHAVAAVVTVALSGCQPGVAAPTLPPTPADAPSVLMPWAGLPEPDFAPGPLLDRDGAPLLLIAPSDRPWARHLAELLRTEGFTTFDVAPTSTPQALSRARIILVGAGAAGDGDVEALRRASEAGADVLLVRPEGALAQLAGLEVIGEQAEGVLVRPERLPLQVHGRSVLYRLVGATTRAELRAELTGAALGPAVSVRRIEGGGRIVAFAFDPAEAVVKARQGNPEWANTSRDGFRRFRSNDLFFGGADRPPGAGIERDPDYVLWALAAAPQADELLRLLRELIIDEDAALPLPRIDYLPDGRRVVVLMTGDDHGSGGTAGRFARFLQLSAPGCSVERWECVRGSSYVDPSVRLDPGEAARWTEEGFEIGLHTAFDDPVDGAAYSALATIQRAALAVSLPGLAEPVSRRNHGAAMSGWAIQPKVHSRGSIRLDVNGYFWPPSWVAGRPGYAGGTILPMRFADTDGSTIDSFGLPTVWTDESGQAYPEDAIAMLDPALDGDGWPGVFTTNLHTDVAESQPADAVIQAARERSVAVVSARQLVSWWEAREALEFTDVTWDGARLTFEVQSHHASGAQLVLPETRAGMALTLRHGGERVQPDVRIERGHAVARAPAMPGKWTAIWSGAAARSTTDGPCAAWTGLPTTLLELTDLRRGADGEIFAEAGALGHPGANQGLAGAAWGRGGASRPAEGAWILDHAWLAQPSPVAAPARLRARVRFAGGPFQSVGFAERMGYEPVAIVSTGEDGVPRATTWSGSGAAHTDPVPVPLGREALIEIDWQQDRVIYSIDGITVATHPVSPAGPLFAIASDYQLGAGLLRLVTLNVEPTPEAAAGHVLSGPLLRTDRLEWSAAAGSTVEVEFESADQPGRWQALPRPGPIDISAPFMRLRAAITGPGPVTFSGRCAP